MSNLPRTARRPNARIEHAKATDTKANEPERKRPGRKKGSPKPPGSGIQKGDKMPYTQQQEKLLGDALREAFNALTKEELRDITPLKVMELCTVSAVQAGNWTLSLMAAEKWAPYVHAKLQKVVHHQGGMIGGDFDNDEEADGALGGGPRQVKIIGGLPTPNNVRDAEVVEETKAPKKKG